MLYPNKTETLEKTRYMLMFILSIMHGIKISIAHQKDYR